MELSNFKLIVESESEILSKRVDDLDEVILLDATVGVNIVFGLTLSDPGEVKVTAIEYDLTTPDAENCEVIRVQQSFKLEGQRQGANMDYFFCKLGFVERIL